MATWTTPRTYTTGELMTAAIQNTYVRDNFDAAVTDTRCVATTATGPGTTTSTSYGSISSGAVATTTVTVPASGQVLVTLAARGVADAGATYASIGEYDGTSTQVNEASDSWGLRVTDDAGEVRASTTHLFTATAGLSRRYFARFRVATGGSTGTWRDIEIIARPIA